MAGCGAGRGQDRVPRAQRRRGEPRVYRVVRGGARARAARRGGRPAARSRGSGVAMKPSGSGSDRSLRGGGRRPVRKPRLATNRRRSAPSPGRRGPAAGAMPARPAMGIPGTGPRRGRCAESARVARIRSPSATALHGRRLPPPSRTAAQPTDGWAGLFGFAGSAQEPRHATAVRAASGSARGRPPQCARRDGAAWRRASATGPQGAGLRRSDPHAPGRTPQSCLRMDRRLRPCPGPWRDG